MSDETRGEDTILGTALARAIDSQPVRSTPFERSRVAVRMTGGGRSGLVPVLAMAAAVVLGLALGAALLGQRGPEPGPAASDPSPAATGPANATASPVAVEPDQDRIWVYFARDQLPVAGAFISGRFDDRDAISRIMSRVDELRRASDGEVPAGTTNAVGLLGTQERTSSGTRGSFEMSGRVDGDLATLEFGPGTFDRIRGAAQAQAVLEQLVYTITEEPGIRRALIKEKGKSQATIDQLVIDKPLTREDVLPYDGVRTEERIVLDDDPRPSTATSRIEDLVGGIRFVIELKADETPEGGFWSPRVIADLEQGDPERQGETGKSKYVLEIGLDGPRLDGLSDVADAARSPLRSVQSFTLPHTTNTIYRLGLDDARPWRLSLEPGAERGTMRLLVDIGGHPRAVSDSVAVYGPKPGDEVSRTFTLTGTARVFEAHVAWRIKDSSDREVASGFVTASIGTSPVWGTFSTEVKVPESVSGVVTLEVFWPSPQDGRDLGKVAIPLRVLP